MKEEIFHRKLINHNRTKSCQIVSEFIELLETTIESLEELELTQKDGRSSIIIEDVLVDLYEGQVAIYYQPNK